MKKLMKLVVGGWCLVLGVLCLGAGTAAAEPVEYKDPSATAGDGGDGGAAIICAGLTVEVVDGVVKIGVSVRKTDDISAKPEKWSNVDFKDENVTVEKSGDRVILTIPVTAAQGFFQIGTGAAE